MRERLLRYLEMREDACGRGDQRPLRSIADELGMAPETLYRLLAELEQAGVIVRQGRSIHWSGQPE